jgi:hypothetical protein
MVVLEEEAEAHTQQTVLVGVTLAAVAQMVATQGLVVGVEVMEEVFRVITLAPVMSPSL